MSFDRSTLPLPRVLALPTRDVMRGMRRAVSVRRGPLGMVLSALEPTGGEPAAPRPRCTPASLSPKDRETLAEAGARVPGALAAAKGRVLVSIVYRGLSILLDQLDRGDLMISETVVDYCVGTAPRGTGEAPEDRAAVIAVSLLRHHAVGFAPGTGFALRDGDLQDGRLAIFAVMLWLVIERGERASPEAELLSLCFNVTSLEAAAIREADDDRKRIAGLLRTLAALI